MKHNNAFVKRIKVERSDDLTFLLESICQENNINNYFATISVAVSQVLEIVSGFSGQQTNQIEFSFEQCVGGVAIGIAAEGKPFESFDISDKQASDFKDEKSYIINNLADRTEVLNEGRGLELDFFVNGIEPELLSSRREKIKQYFINLSLNHSNK